MSMSTYDPATAAAIDLGGIRLSSPVLLAPMSGVSDWPFRRLVHREGAGLVVSEMVASDELVRGRRDMRARAEGRELQPFAIQLAGREPRWMAEGARVAQDLGAEIIDINMGCPAREVTGKLSGSALMRDLDLAERLIEATVAASRVPVTLKMRLGWDDRALNAPELARRAESQGIRLLTVHARTRCQFFTGTARWALVRAVREAVSLPLIVNGDIVDLASASSALEASGADGVMIGRGAYGAPWLPRRIAEGLATGRDPGPPALAEQARIATAHVEDMLSFYGRELGLKTARKHIGWYLASSGAPEATVRSWRRRLCPDDDATRVLAGLAAFYAGLPETQTGRLAA